MKKAPKKKLSHLNAKGDATMVDVAGKDITSRVAVAQALVFMQPATLKLLKSGNAKKGDVLGVARVAGIQAAKKTSELIPLCHPLALTSVAVDFQYVGADLLFICATAHCDGKTGVEMEALTAASVSALTVYDMLKAVDRGITISQIKLVEKLGGKTRHWKRND